MNEIEQSFRDYDRILSQLDEVMRIPREECNSRDRDSAILRFELTFEVCWKLLQRLVRQEGFECNGPRQALERAFSLGWIADEGLWFDLLKDRNMAVHVYREEWALALFERLPRYHKAFVELRKSLPVQR